METTSSSSTHPTDRRESGGSQEPPSVNKRARITGHACELCRAGKKKCDGKQPCSACIASRKECIFSAQRRRTRTAGANPRDRQTASTAPPNPHPSDHSRSPTAVRTPSSARTPSAQDGRSVHPSNPPQQLDFAREGNSIDSRSNQTVPGMGTGSVNVGDITDGGTGAADQQGSSASDPNANLGNTLARLAHVMANGSVSRLPSPGPANNEGRSTSPRPDGSGKGDLLDRLHRHLTVVFSLRSFPKGHLGEGQQDENDLYDHDEGMLFLPPYKDGEAYIQCYFEHATSTYRYLERHQIERLVEEFYAANGALGHKDDVVLLLLLMASGCLWTPSWTGVDSHLMTQKSLQLLRAAQRHLSRLNVSKPRLRLVQIHIALCHLHLGMSQFRAAWLALGTAARLSQLLRLHCKSPHGTPREVDEPRRQAFWSSFMMDRYLSLVLGCPVIYDERDITQELPTCPQGGAVDSQDEDQRLVGCIAHIKLSQILGHALRQLKSPSSLMTVERSLVVQSLNQELSVWLAQTPRFFHPDGPEHHDISPFVSVSPFFRRQQQLVQAAFNFINLFIYRSYLLDQFNNRVASPLTAMSPEVTVCVEAALSIARSVSRMRENPGEKRTFWNSAYFCFASLTVLLVYLMVYEEAPRRAEIESMIEAAMEGHMQLTGSTKRDQEHVLEELKRLSNVLHCRQGEAQTTIQQDGNVVPPWMGMDNLFAGNITDWDPLWQNTLDMLGFDLSMGSSLPMGLGTVEGAQAAAADIGALNF